jgi:hypothetical protein
METLQAEITDFFTKHIPVGWFTGRPEIVVDADEILVTGELPEPPAGDDSGEDAAAATIAEFREETRRKRIRIAEQAERLYRRKVSWAVRLGDTERTFTSLSVPVMTRLRITERQVLDTLIEAGVARSRSDALAWCVRLVGKHEADWLAELREALVAVQRVRAEGLQRI